MTLSETMPDFPEGTDPELLNWGGATEEDEVRAECTELADKITAMADLIKRGMTIGSTTLLEEALEIAGSIEEK